MEKAIAASSVDPSTLEEGTVSLINWATWGLPAGGFLAIVLLFQFAYGRFGTITFSQRLLFSLPAGFIIVSSFNSLLSQVGDPNWVSIIFVTGIVMEHAVLIEFGAGEYIKRRMAIGGDTERNSGNGGSPNDPQRT